MPIKSVLSFGGDGVSIAQVKGGKHSKEILYLSQTDSGNRPKFEPDIGNELLRKIPPRRQQEILRDLTEALEKGVDPEHLMIKERGAKTLYQDMVKSRGDPSCIKLPIDSTFQIIPDEKGDKRSIYYIAGASGSGKSHIAKGIAEKYQQFFPERCVYLISKLPFDETLDSMKNKPIRLNIEKLKDNPPKDLEFLRDSLIIFDDYDSYTKPYDKVVETLMNDIATMGKFCPCVC